MSKKIGILTFWGVPNFGAWAQAYALNNVTNQLFHSRGYEVEHIAYLSPIHYGLMYNNNERLRNSFHYNWDIIPHSSTMTGEDLEETHYDTIITGSDSIWEFSMESTGDDSHLIGNNLNTNKLISYAASAGISVEEKKPFMIEGLRRYDSISVRDEATQDMVGRLVDRDAVIVPDPSLLYDFASDDTIPVPVYEHYILVYGIIWDDEYVSGLIKFAKENNYKLISAGYLNDWCDMNFRMIELRAKEWVGLIKGADYVAASMFHGFMLGLKFRKRLFFFSHEYVKNRSDTLIKVLNIPVFSRKIEDCNSEKWFYSEWDQAGIDVRLGEYIKKGYCFLENSIDGA